MKPSQKGNRVAALTAVFLALFVALTGAFWPRGKAVLQELLLPGDAAVTAAALEDLAAELSNGEEISDALESFCRKVIHGSQSDSN